jgi:hypothetical protein
MKRWTVEATYRTKSATSTAHFQIEELEELHEIIESGPDWFAIAEIKITLSPTRIPLTHTTNAAVQRVAQRAK